MSAEAARLWRWAGRGVKGAAFESSPEVHYDTAAFIDAIHTSSHVLRVLFPVVRGFAALRHRLRGTTMPPEADNPEMLANWNSSQDFLDGTEQTHRELLGALWRPRAETLPLDLREGLSPDVQKWLERSRAADKFRDAEDDVVANIITVSVRFERLYGPRSLDYIKDMDLSALGSLSRDPERLSAFHQDTVRGSPLNLEVAAVAESEWHSSRGGVEPRTLRRADRLRLACDFNLREGIASPFRIAGVEELLV